MEYTPNYSLRKPGYGDSADIADINYNTTEIDRLLYRNRSIEGNPYDTAITYNTGDLVIYEHALYRCLEDGVTGAWNASKWAETDLATEVASKGEGGGGVVANNAGYHNSIYRGKYLGNTITDAQWASIRAGTFEDMYIGDYWTLPTTINGTTSNRNYVIAGFDYWWNCGDSYPQGANYHHVVLVPSASLYSAQMNATNTTTGAYVGSAMYTTNLEAARTGISALFGNHLYSVRRLFATAVNSVGQATSWGWYTSSVNLMNEVMVYGTNVWSASGYEVGVDRTILPLFAHNPASASIRAYWWLRSVASPAYFCYVDNLGLASYSGASYSLGVRPAFAIY